jgi:cystathionine beta-lyase
LCANRDFLMNFIQAEMPGVRCTAPEGTYLAWLDFRETPAALDPAQFFLENARVGLFTGKAFGIGGDGFARLNFACPQALLKTALERMASALRSGGKRSTNG